MAAQINLTSSELRPTQLPPNEGSVVNEDRSSPYLEMGALPKEDGVSFRVWAPFARQVNVAGDFNDWSTTSQPLTPDKIGNWSAFVSDSKIGDNYKFILTTFDNQLIWKNDPYARCVKSVDAQGKSLGAHVSSVVYPANFQWKVPNFSIDNWNELVIYELHIGTFTADQMNTAASGRGTFKSAESKLDHLQNLGINAIEIMAAAEFPSDRSWGYNPSYIYAVEELYNGPDAFRNFVDACHQRGIAVIFDVVYNHLGTQELDMWRFDGWSEHDQGGIWFYNDWRSNTPWGCTRLDYGRREVRSYLHDNAVYWLASRGADGLRWDGTAFIRNAKGTSDSGSDIAEGWSLMQWINDEVRSKFPKKITIAEDMQNNEWLTKPTAAGGAGFASQWDALFIHSIRATINAPHDQERDMYLVARAIGNCYNNDAFQRVIYTESHDEDANGHQRVPEEIWPSNSQSYFSKKRSTLGAGIALTTPGIPMIFQGQELLEDGYFNDIDVVDWKKLDSNPGIFNMYKDLIRLRRNFYNNTRGLTGQNLNIFHINNADKLLAYHRWQNGGTGDDVIVIANFSNRGFTQYNIGLPRPGRWRVRFNSDWNGYSPDFGDFHSNDTESSAPAKDGLPVSADVGIGPYTIVILSQ